MVTVAETIRLEQIDATEGEGAQRAFFQHELSRWPYRLGSALPGFILGTEIRLSQSDESDPAMKQIVDNLGASLGVFMTL